MIDNLGLSEVYVVLGIDAQANDQVVAVCASFTKAKEIIAGVIYGKFFDLWMEKHTLI